MYCEYDYNWNDGDDDVMDRLIPSVSLNHHSYLSTDIFVYLSIYLSIFLSVYSYFYSCLSPICLSFHDCLLDFDLDGVTSKFESKSVKKAEGAIGQ